MKLDSTSSTKSTLTNQVFCKHISSRQQVCFFWNWYHMLNIVIWVACSDHFQSFLCQNVNNITITLIYKKWMLSFYSNFSPLMSRLPTKSMNRKMPSVLSLCMCFDPVLVFHAHSMSRMTCRDASMHIMILKQSRLYYLGRSTPFSYTFFPIREYIIIVQGRPAKDFCPPKNQTGIWIIGLRNFLWWRV